MNVTNLTRQRVIADKAERADTFLSRGRGLMLKPPIPVGGGLIIDPCNSIHMFFMRYPLDVLFLDSEGMVVFLYKGIKPWRMGRIVRGARLAIELPEGAIDKTGTQLGDKIAVG